MFFQLQGSSCYIAYFFPAEVSPLPSYLYNANEVLLVTHSFFSTATSHINPAYDQGLSDLPLKKKQNVKTQKEVNNNIT